MIDQELKNLYFKRECLREQVYIDFQYYIDECDRLANIAGNAGEIITKIDYEFAEATKLKGKDVAFLFLTIALQCARQYIFANDNFRLTAKQGDTLVKNTIGKITPKSWQDIIFQSVPYDAVQSNILNTGISGKTHRYRTLGHDPVIGWIIGPCNMVTDSLTKTDFITSYSVKGMRIVAPYKLGTAGMIADSISAFSSDKMLIPTTIIRQAVHFGSDYFTKMGLPLPFVSSINEQLSADMLSRFHIDSYSIIRGATIAIIINNIISCIHKLFYDPIIDGDEALYDVRTRKIIDYSNSIASASNIIYCALSKDLTKLDVGGILVTLIRLVKDTKFIQEVKEEYLRNRWNEIVLNSSHFDTGGNNMKEKHYSKYEQGLKDGSAPFKEKCEDMSDVYDKLRNDIDARFETEKKIRIMEMNEEERAEKIKTMHAAAELKHKIDTAITQYKNFGIEEAFTVLQEAAPLGDVYGPNIYYYLGDIYYYGYDKIPKDTVKSCECFKKGYVLENGKLENYLCALKLAELFPTYLPDKIYPNDIYDAILSKMITTASDPKSSNAIIEYELGLIYEMGYGTDIDYEKAFINYKKSADKNFFKALYSVYRCYLTGLGTNKDPQKAGEYLNKCRRMGYKK